MNNRDFITPEYVTAKEIKTVRTKLGLTQKEFADLLGLSRPTLDNYIDLYEAGEKLPKERYQIIFDDLLEEIKL